MRCNVCRLDFMCDNLAVQEGSSRHNSTTTPHDLVESYSGTRDQDVRAARESLKLRIPLLEGAFGGRLSSACEIGCSTGTGFLGFQEHSIDWLGLETDQQWIRLGREQGVPIIEADLADLGQRFDLIYCHQVLEHIWEPTIFMRSIFECLNPGGVVHVAVPNHAGFTSRVRRTVPSFFPEEFGMLQPPHHLRAYSPFTLRKLFQDSGFKPIEVRGVSHTDPCWGEWFQDRGSLRNRLVFAAGAKLGLGTLLFGYAVKPRS
jgi:SAM-dependent methyltransferase